MGENTLLGGRRISYLTYLEGWNKFLARSMAVILPYSEDPKTLTQITYID
jgi:hypothetical protein